MQRAVTRQFLAQVFEQPRQAVDHHMADLAWLDLQYVILLLHLYQITVVQLSGE